MLRCSGYVSYHKAHSCLSSAMTLESNSARICSPPNESEISATCYHPLWCARFRTCSHTKRKQWKMFQSLRGASFSGLEIQAEMAYVLDNLPPESLSETCTPSCARMLADINRLWSEKIRLQISWYFVSRSVEISSCQHECGADLIRTIWCGRVRVVHKSCSLSSRQYTGASNYDCQL